MKIRDVVFLSCAAALLPKLALADAPHNPMEFGMVQAVYDFCSKLDPKYDKRFDQMAKQALGNMSKQDRDDTQHSAAYEQGYQIVGSLLKGLHPTDAISGCATIVTPSKAIDAKR